MSSDVVISHTGNGWQPMAGYHRRTLNLTLTLILTLTLLLTLTNPNPNTNLKLLQCISHAGQ